MKRTGGILLHITSLPGEEGIGTMGKGAFDFVDLLKEAGLGIWQILPLGPSVKDNSPYQCFSAFAGNPLLIDLNELQNSGLLLHGDINKDSKFSKKEVDYTRVIEWKFQIFRKAFENFKSDSNPIPLNDYNGFLEEHGWWLNDYALFMACRENFGNITWTNWDKDIKFREKQTLEKYSARFAEEIDFHRFLQFLFFTQWHRLKRYANSKGVKIIGDMPLYVSADSVDVWTNPDIFQLDKNLKMTHVGGVPPDYFSEDGQLWGNPLYDWDALKKRDFDWWIARLHFNFGLFDLVRIDHFRGLDSYWSVAATEETAVNGKWIPAGGAEMLAKLNKQVTELPLVAEDLGVITPEVVKLRDAFNLPGMKVLQFAFSSDASNEYLPHNYEMNFLAYTGTHDNDTMVGWYKNLTKKEKMMLRKYFRGGKNQVAGWAVETIWASVAGLAVAPVQDILSLGSRARMNTPGKITGNWVWRLKSIQLLSKHTRFMKELGEKYGRLNNK